MNSQGEGKSFKEDTLSEQLRLAMNQLPTMQAASFVVALVLGYTVRATVPRANICVWILMVLAVVVSRIVYYFRFLKVRDDLFSGTYWQNIYLVLAFVSGAVWGLSAFIIFPAGNPGLISLFVLVMASLSAATTVSHSSIRLAPTAWAGPAMLLYAIRCTMEGGETGFTISALIVLYLFTILRYSLIHHDTITSTISLRFENSGLLEDLRQARQGLEARVEERTTELRRSNESLIRAIEERQSAEAALRVGEEKYRELVKHAKSIVLRWNAQGIITFVNEFAQQFFGYTEDELLGKNLMGTIVAGTSREGVDLEKMIQNIWHNQRAFERNENENVRKNGERVWVSWTNQPIFSESGELVELLSIGQDMTERKQAQEALRESEQKYRLLADHVSDVIFTTDLDLRLTYVSPSAERLYGWTAEELQAFHPSDYMTPASSKLVFEALAAELALQDSPEADPNRTRTLEIEQVRKDGTDFWTEVTARFLYNGGGDTVGIIGATRDITQRKRTDKALQESEERFRSLIRNSSDLITVLTADGVTAYQSPALKRILGYEPEELTGVNAFDYVHPEDLAAAQLAFSGLIRQGGVSSPIQHRCRHADGTWVYMETVGSNHLGDSAVRGVILNSRDITERKRAEEALKASEAFRKRVFDSSRVPMIVMDGATFRYIDCNPAAAEIYRFSSIEETIGKTPLDVSAPLQSDGTPSLEKARFYVNKALAEGMVIFDWRHQRPDGEIWDAEVHLMSFQAENRQFLQFTLQDITERKRAIEALRASEKKYRSVIENIQDVFYRSDASGRLLMSSPSGAKMFGYDSVDEMIGLPLDLFWPDPVGRHQLIAQIKATGSVRDFDAVLKRKDGTMFNALFTTHFYYDDQGELLGTEGIIRDVTDRKRAEEEMSRLRNYLENIINSMPSVLVGVDGAGKVTQWNAAAEGVTGIPAEAAHGQLLERVLPTLSHEREKIWEAIRDRTVMSDTKVSRVVNGETRYEDVTIFPLAGGGVEGAVIRVDDVTERMRIEEMMVQSEKMLSVGGLAAGMAHEINNPLGVILQASQNVLRRVSPDLPANARIASACGTTLSAVRSYLEQREIMLFLEDIRNSGVRAAQIVEDMLFFSQMSDTQGIPTDLMNLLDRTVALAASDYDLKKGFDFREIEIIREYHPDVPLAVCQASKIQQVFLNILRNGAEAMMEVRASGRVPRFVLRVLRDESMVRIEIEDNGPGMDEGMRRRVFEPFFTTKDPGEGIGLGLSVSYFIVTEDHGGTLSVESAPGTGSRFIIRLPVEGRG